MLRQRLLTAAILAPVFIAAIYLLPLPAVALVFAVVVSVAAWEWAGLTVGSSVYVRGLGAALEFALLLLLWFWPQLQLPLVLAGMLMWTASFIQVFRFRSPASNDPANAVLSAKHRWWQGKRGLAYGLLLLAAAWSALLTIRAGPEGSHLLLALFALVWVADAGAFFAGRAFGKTKLAPQVSPGKTWEGALGGLLASLTLVLAGLYLAGWLAPMWPFVLVGLIAISVLGDLFESVLKRSAGAKDSGQLLPGHGGVLDRIDSIIAVLPFLAAALLFLALPPVAAGY